jgi:outer membrane usher protein
MRTIRKSVFSTPCFSGRFFFRTCLTILCIFFITSGISRAEPAILEIVLNGEKKGTFFVEAMDDGDFLINIEDFDVLGMPKPKGEPTTIEDGKFFSLAQHQGLTFELDEATLALKITVNPEVLPLKRIDFTQKRPAEMPLPLENSLFMNYGLSLSGDKDDSLQQTDLTHELAIRNGRVLFLSDGTYSDSVEESAYTRLLSRLIRDDRETLRRLTVGDHYVLSGPLGGQVLLGGAGYAKNFDIDPYFINYPSVQIGGAAATPSTAEIYIDGMLVKKEELPPGPFLLENITRYEGAGDVEVVIRDAFNQEQRISHPFYLAEKLLVAGKHEYSYNAGALRELFGIESNEYGDTAFSGFHRYGYRNWLTLGLSSEISPDFFSIAPRVSLKWHHYGFFDFAIASSSGSEEHNGFATAAEYFYQNRRYSTGIKLRHFSENYSRLDDFFRTDRPELEAQFRIGYSTAGFGSMNLALTSTTFHAGDDRDEVALTYNRRLSRNLSMYVTANHISEVEDETIMLVGFNYSPWRHHQVSARFEERERSSSASVSLQKDPPTGEGYGYRATIDSVQADASDANSLGLAGQYNGRHGILRADTAFASIDSEFRPSYLTSASGAVSYLGGETFFTRPIRDSFTLVKVGEIEGVRVVRNAEVIGETDPEGYVLIPELTSYYDNEISLKDEDLPIEYGLETSRLFVQPPLRSGSCITFSAQRIQPLTGKFRFNQGGKVIPYEYRPLKIYVGETVIKTQTGYDGEFYIDTAEAGSGHAVLTGCEHLADTDEVTGSKILRIEYNFDGTTGIFNLETSESEELFIELGELVLNDDAE